MSNAIVLPQYLYVIVPIGSSKTIWFEQNVQLKWADSHGTPPSPVLLWPPQSTRCVLSPGCISRILKRDFLSELYPAEWIVSVRVSHSSQRSRWQKFPPIRCGFFRWTCHIGASRQTQSCPLGRQESSLGWNNLSPHATPPTRFTSPVLFYLLVFPNSPHLLGWLQSDSL